MEEPGQAREFQSREAPTRGRARVCSGQCPRRACAAPCVSGPDLESQSYACTVPGSACRPPPPPPCPCHGDRVPRGPAVTTVHSREPLAGRLCCRVGRPPPGRRRLSTTGGRGPQAAWRGGDARPHWQSHTAACRERALTFTLRGGRRRFEGVQRRVMVTHGSDGASRKRFPLVACRICAVARS